jgi:hypothetical protein
MSISTVTVIPLPSTPMTPGAPGVAVASALGQVMTWVWCSQMSQMTVVV